MNSPLTKTFKKNGELLNGFHKIRSKKLNVSGTFKNGKLNGHGRGTYVNGGKKWKCNGEWKKNKLEGRGKCTFITKKNSRIHKSVHDGIWKNDYLAKGKMISPYFSKKTNKMQNVTQIGTFKNGKLNGNCEIKWRNALYKGLCKNDIQHGKGTYIFEGKKYTGNWSGKQGKLKLNGTRNWGA